MIPTGWQTRGGRELISMFQADLAAAAGVGLAVVVRAELAAHADTHEAGDSAAIQETLEAAGIVFVQEQSKASLMTPVPQKPATTFSKAASATSATESTSRPQLSFPRFSNFKLPWVAPAVERHWPGT